LLIACGAPATPTFTPTPTVGAFAAVSPTASAAPTQTPVAPTSTPSLTLTATITSTSTDTPTPTSTATPTPKPVVNLLVNGGFEAGDLFSWDNLGGITISPAAAYSGSYGAQMESNGGIQQTFKTRVGQTYSISARVRIDQEIVTPPWGGLLVSVTSWDWKQRDTSPFLTAQNSPVGQWTTISFSFVATTDVSRLTYQNFTGGGGQFRASADVFTVIAK